MLTAPPIRMHDVEPSTRTKPGPYSAHDFDGAFFWTAVPLEAVGLLLLSARLLVG